MSSHLLVIDALEMIPAAQVLRPETPVVTAARVMDRYGAGELPVVEHWGRLAGVVVDADIILLCPGSDEAAKPVSEVMRVDFPVLCPEERLEGAISLMLKHGHSRLPVIGKFEIAVGILDFRIAVEVLYGSRRRAQLQPRLCPKRQAESGGPQLHLLTE
jgi:CBS domain-containing protein